MKILERAVGAMMSRRFLYKLLAMTMGFGLMINYNKEIVETGNKYYQKAKEVVALYNQRTEEINAIDSELTKERGGEK